MHYANETKDTFGHYLTCKLDKIIYNGLKLTSTSPSSSGDSPSNFSQGQIVMRRDVVNIKGEEEKPLIELELEEDNGDVSWETLLETSISFSHAYQRDLGSLFNHRGWEGGFHIEQHGFL